MRGRLPRAFFARPALEVAPDLLGRVLVRIMPSGRRLSARIVEAEAYEESDPASHSFRGRRTPRNEVMFGAPGHLYVYFTYGLHFCANVVTGRAGEGSAVLLRAAEPLEGIGLMARRRGTTDARLLCAGPARICQAFALGRAENGADLVRDPGLGLEEGRPLPASSVAALPRVGTREGAELPWAFVEAGSRFLSGPAARRSVSPSPRTPTPPRR